MFVDLGLLLHVTTKNMYFKYSKKQIGKKEEWRILSGVNWPGGGDPLAVLHT